jgi:high-affinity nickel permease
LGSEWGNGWFLIGNAVNGYLKKEFDIKADYLKKIVMFDRSILAFVVVNIIIISHISASVCWKSSSFLDG